MARRSSNTTQRKRRINRHTLAIKPQFTLEETYITAFTERRIFAPDGNEHYEPIENRQRITHIEMFDAYRIALDEGLGSLRSFCDQYGLTVPYLNGFIFALTGMDAMTYRISWQMTRADELLRYTDLPIPEVARMSGVGSSPNLFYACRRDYGSSPSQRRFYLRGENDLGRYR